MATKGATFGKTRSQELIDMAAAEVFGEDGLPLIHPGDIKWSFDLADPDKPDQTSVEPREVPGSDYARAPVHHQWGEFRERCERCGLTRELVEDFAPDCGEPVDVRDVVIAALFRALAKVPYRAKEQAEKLLPMLEELRVAVIAERKALQRMTESYELSCVARDQLRSRARILEEDNARLKTELDRHPWARRMV